MTNDRFRETPWLTHRFRCEPDPVGMLGADEASLFHWLASEAFTGRGQVVDAGAFLGKSAVYLATGLRANHRFDGARHRVHCFDNFLVNEAETVAFMQRKFGKELAIGDSTRPFFDTQVAPVRDLLELHVGDFVAATWDGGPIEILMVDLAKSDDLNRRVAEIFFRHLVPGAFVIQQDYHHPWLPHIHATMEFLAPWCELVVPRCDHSAVFVVRQAIPEAAIERLVHGDFAVEEKERLMDAAIARLPAADRHHVELARVIQRGATRGWRAARKELAAAAPRLDAFLADESFVSTIESVRDSIEEQQGWESKQAGDYADAQRCATALIERGRSFATALLMRGAALRLAGDPAASIADLRRCRRLPSPSPWVAFELAAALSDAGDQAAAERELLAMLRDPVARAHLPTQLWLHLLGQTWLRAFDLAAVRERIAELQRLMAKDPEYWAFEARVRVRIGERHAGVQALRKARELGLTDARLTAVLPDLGMQRAEFDVMFGDPR